jgi:ATP-dependent DNA helicase RecG
MVNLTDRLDGIVGGKAAGLLDDVFGIRTVDDLLRHYPRKYIHGMSVWGDDEAPPEEGEHITLVGEIDKAEVRWTNRRPKREYLVITLGKGRRKVTATFFNAKWLKKQLVVGVRLMLSGEVGFFNGNMQLTHPDFLALNSPTGRVFGSKSLKTIADTSTSESGELAMSAFERDFFPSTPPAPSCRVGTSTPACNRYSQCWIRSPIRCPKALCVSAV